MSLQVGKEIFDVAINIDNSAAIPRAGAQTAPATPAKQASTDQTVFPTGPVQTEGLSYLVAQHKSSAVLQAEALISGAFSLRPTGMQSETHKRLVRAVGQKHNKVARLRIAPDMSRDPDPEKAATGKKRKSGVRRKYDGESDSDGGLERRRRQQRRSSFGRNRSARNMYSDDDDEGEELEALATDEDEEVGTKKRRSNAKPKRDVAGAYEADDFVVDDPPSDKDEDGEQPEEEEGTEPDELDKMDQQIERQVKQRRQETHVDIGKAEESVDMDMSESEGDQSPGISRKPAAAGRKKIIIEDEDE